MSYTQYLPSLRGVTDVVIGIQTGWKVIGYGLTGAKGGMVVYGKAHDYTDGASNATFATTIALSGLNFLLPIKTPVNAMLDVVNSAKQPIRRIERQLEKLDGTKITTASQETLEWFDSVNDSLSAATVVHSAILDSLTLLIWGSELAIRASENQGAATNSVRQIEGVAGDGSLPAASDYSDLFLALDQQAAPRVAAMAAIAPTMDAVRRKVDEFNALFENIDFSGIITQMDGLERVGELLEKLKVPLDIAINALNPIKPLLDAIGLISELVDSVVDFVVETIGLGGVLDEAREAITDLLPSPDIFDELLAQVQPLYDILQEMLDEALGAAKMLTDLNLAAFGDGMGDALQGAIGWADDGDNVLRGDDLADVLDALNGDDTIYAGGGNDIIVAGVGNDEIWGEGGNDFIHFNASFTEYELARERLSSDTDEATGDIIVSHVKPFGNFNSGVDVLRGLDDGDVVAFSDISFSGQELKDAFIGGSVLTGSAQNDLMFLNSTGTRIDGFYVAEGLEGDDRIFGSTEDDRLIGGAGDDVLLPGEGDDEALGGTGVDTFQVLEGARSSLRIDLEAGTAFGQGSDELVDIENVIAMPGQKHFVRGTDDANTIFTASGIDVITGRGGDDVIRSGGEDDYIVGGAGADTIDGGTGFNIMVSGSAAAAGVSDTYIGGEDYDVVAYTSSSNTIKFDVNDQSDDPSILQQLKNYMEEIEDSGRVEIDGTTGQIARFDADGTHVATDLTEGVEGFVGSDVADLLIGGSVAEYLHGGGGDDVIRTNGTESIDGGDGDDVIYAQRVDGGSTQLQIEGGAGTDRLTLDGVGEARWFYLVQSAIALELRAHDIATEGDDLRNAQGSTFSIKPRDIEVIVLGDYADHAIYEPGGSQTTVFELGGGDDRFDGENGFADVYAGLGNDIGNFDGGGGGIFRGGAGDDLSIWDDTTTANAALMGEGTDTVEIQRFKGHADGGDGYDTIGFEIAFSSRIVADLALGDVQSFKGVTTNNAEQVDMTLEGFEQLIATDYNDLVMGSDGGERIVGRGGRDTLEGRGGNDEIYGGTGDDTLLGDAGDDVLHGGAGADSLDGGAGRDMASYAWTQPGGVDGALTATAFGGVVVDLVQGQATGAFGSDVLRNIENVTGSAGNDALTGNGSDNFLSGGAADDTLLGGAGDDVLVTGSGNDTADGGAGDDRIVVGLGTTEIAGGSGTDTLDFGLIDGLVTVDLAAGSYTAEIETEVPRWILLDVDGDGTADGDGFEARNIGGVMMTPEDVFQTNPLYADDAEDLLRVLPQEGDEGFDAAQVDLVVRSVEASGTFTGIEIIKGALSDDRFVGTSNSDLFDGGEGPDVLVGGDGVDSLLGSNGDDLLIGEEETDVSTGTEGQVFRVYKATLDRLPDTGGFDNWTQRLEDGTLSLVEVIDGFTNSPEFQATYGSLDDDAFVELLYQNVLDRPSDSQGLARWTNDLANGTSRAEVVRGFSESQEFKTNTNPMASAFAEARDQGDWIDDVFRLYRATLDRTPDDTGLDRWSGELALGANFEDVARGFVNSPEFQRDYGGLSNEEFVTLLYNNVLDRAPDDRGLENWTGALASGRSREAVVVGFSQSEEFTRDTAPDVDRFMEQRAGDVFTGGMGDDVLAGGYLADMFVFDAELDGRDTVLQLDPWDTLQFNGFDYANRSEAVAQMQVQGRDVVFSDSDVTVVFADNTLADIQSVEILI